LAAVAAPLAAVGQAAELVAAVVAVVAAAAAVAVVAVAVGKELVAAGASAGIPITMRPIASIATNGSVTARVMRAATNAALSTAGPRRKKFWRHGTGDWQMLIVICVVVNVSDLSQSLHAMGRASAGNRP
jgi:hypothetical protein